MLMYKNKKSHKECKERGKRERRNTRYHNVNVIMGWKAIGKRNENPNASCTGPCRTTKSIHHCLPFSNELRRLISRENRSTKQTSFKKFEYVNSS